MDRFQVSKNIGEIASQYNVRSYDVMVQYQEIFERLYQRRLNNDLKNGRPVSNLFSEYNTQIRPPALDATRRFFRRYADAYKCE